MFFDFNFAETDLVTFDLENLAVSVLEGEHSGIEVRRFSRPTLRGRKRKFKMHGLLATIRTNCRNFLCSRLNDFGTSCIVERKFYSVISRFLTRGVVDPSSCLQETIFVAVGKSSVNLEVLNVNFWNSVNVNITHDTGKTDEILVFEPRAVAPAEHLHGDVVFTLAEIFIDIEFVARERVFTIANIVAVYPHVICRFNAFEVQTDTLAIPRFGNCKVAAIMTYRVKICRSIRSRNAVVLRPRINHVRINRMVVTQKLPRARNLDFVPLGHIVIILIEIVVALARFFDVEEFPLTRKRLVPFRSVAVTLHSFFDSRVRHRSHVRRKRIHAKNSWLAIPFIVRLSKSRCCQNQTGRNCHRQSRCELHRVLPFIFLHKKIPLKSGYFSSKNQCSVDILSRAKRF